MDIELEQKIDDDDSNKYLGCVKTEIRELLEDANTFSCDRCGKYLSTKEALAIHKTIHAEMTKYKCSFCEKIFMQRQHLVVHERRHTGDKRYKCDECGKASYLKSEAVGRSRDDEEAQLVNV